MLRNRLIFILVLLLVFTGCERTTLPHSEEDGAELCVKVRIPGYVLTKTAEVEPETGEDVINNLYIWVFKHATGECLGFLSPDQAKHQLTQYEDRLYLRISREVAVAKPAVDVYVLGNSESLNLDWNGLTTRSALDDYMIAGSRFGRLESGFASTSASSLTSGIPFSAVMKDVSMEGTYPSLTLQTAILKRAASKIRFVLCQFVDTPEHKIDVTLNEISLDQSMISANEYLFNDSSNGYKISGYYETNTIKFPLPSQMALNPNAPDYIYDSGQMSAQQYQDLVLSGIEAGALTNIGPYYLRETDKPLGGHIKYTMGGVQKEATFAMDANYKFVRNSNLIVYIYFAKDNIYVNSVSILDWVKRGGSSIIVKPR